MPFSNKLIWHNWTTGSANNGGGFNPASPNFANDLTTDANTGNTSSPVVSSASYTFVAGDVGHWLFIQGGTNWYPGWFQIASVSGGKATLSAASNQGVKYESVDTNSDYYQRPNGLLSTVGVASVGTPTGGVWSVDYSQSNTARTAYTDLVIDGTTNTIITSAANPFGKNHVGNVINVTSGTGFTVQRVEIISVTGTQATGEKSFGTLSSTGGNGNLGGAVGSSSAWTAITIPSLSAGNHIFIKSGTYTVTATQSTNSLSRGDVTNGFITVEGFNSYPSDYSSTRPLLTSSTNSVNLVGLVDSRYWRWRNFNMSHTATTRGAAFSFSSPVTPIYLSDISCNGNSGFASLPNNNNILFSMSRVEIQNCTGNALSYGNTSSFSIHGCYIHNNSGAAILSGANGNHGLEISNSLICENAGGGILMTNDTNAGTNIDMYNCTIANNGNDGLFLPSNLNNFGLRIVGNIFYGNSGYGIEVLDAETKFTTSIFANNAFGNNTSGGFIGLIDRTGSSNISLLANPFVNDSIGDYTLNNTAGGGLDCKNNPVPNIFGSSSTLPKALGAARNQDSGGGGSVAIPVSGRICS